MIMDVWKSCNKGLD